MIKLDNNHSIKHFSISPGRFIILGRNRIVFLGYSSRDGKQYGQVYDLCLAFDTINLSVFNEWTGLTIE